MLHDNLLNVGLNKNIIKIEKIEHSEQIFVVQEQ